MVSHSQNTCVKSRVGQSNERTDRQASGRPTAVEGGWGVREGWASVPAAVVLSAEGRYDPEPLHSLLAAPTPASSTRRQCSAALIREMRSCGSRSTSWANQAGCRDACRPRDTHTTAVSLSARGSAYMTRSSSGGGRWGKESAVCERQAGMLSVEVAIVHN